MMQMYSPFDKATNDLQPADLSRLKTVSEGWYVEYKSALVNPSALAKAVSAFANTYGGWLFLGVKEHSKGDSVAGEFPGIPEQEVDSALQRLRHSATENLNPTPFFETRVLRGPCAEIGLTEGVSVVVIEIPQSHTAPHVHKDGRIYRRVADGSEPKPETDRFILDQLWRRSEPIRKVTRKWVKRDPEFSDAEKGMPYVRLLLCVDPWQQHDLWLDEPFSEIRSILTSSLTGNHSFPFDTVYTIGEEIIARHTKGNNPYNYGLTWRFKRDMSCDIVLPLSFYAPSDLHSLNMDLDGYEQKTHFIRILREQGHTQSRIADLNFLMFLLSVIVSKYRYLLNLADADREFYFKARVLNAWRVLPFIDIETVLSEFETHGLPMIMDSTVTFPFGDEPESFARICEPEIEHSEDKETLDRMGQVIHMFMIIANMFGVRIIVKDGSTIPYSELRDIRVRALTVHENRNKRNSEV